MNQKARWKKEYLRLTRELNKLTDGYDCGLELASFINPRIAEVQAELDALVAEIRRAM